MRVYSILNEMIQNKLAVVLRGENIEEVEETADACVEAGIKILEITFTVPNADRLLDRLKDKYEEVIVGAGTVLDSETARIAILSGATFIVSPSFNIETAKLCHRYAVPYLPGCMTVNEVLAAVETGVSVVKLFPGSAFTPNYIKNIHGPLPHIEIMPTGGITLDNVQSWLQAGACMVGVGGEITSPAKSGNYDEVKRLATLFQHEIGQV